MIGGAGWEYTRFFEVAPGEPETNSTAAVLFGTDLTWEATSKIDVVFNYNLSVPVPDTSTNSFHTSLGLEIELWKDLDLDVTLIWDRQNDPAVSGVGGEPKSDDIRLYIGVGFEF